MRRCDLVSHSPRQQLLDAIDRMLGDTLDHIAQVRLGIDAVELGRTDQAVDRGGTLAAGIGTGEQVILAPECNCAVILPISGRKSKSITAGIRCTGAMSSFAAASSSAPRVELSTLRQRLA